MKELVDDKVAIQEMFDELRSVMRLYPDKIYNAQMQWILRINKVFSKYKKLTQKQFDIIQNIHDQVFGKINSSQKRHIKKSTLKF